MSFVSLIERTRGGTLECQHLGAVAVVNTQGRLLASAGDPYWRSFTRSTLKAFQALPLMQAGGPAHFGFTPRQVALLCASHSGEATHVTEVDGMLAKTGLRYQALRCGCHVPYIYNDTPLPPGLQFDERHNNCSGKHAGFLAWCVQHGAALDSYEDPAHPLQAAIRLQVARTAGLDEQDLVMGIDGCSAPNYAMPLAHLARSYARLATGIADSEFGDSFAQLSAAMTAHPDLVSGTGRNDEAFMRVGRGDWVSKVGADGVQVIGSKSRGEALAVKIADGDKPALFAATVEVLDQLGWLDDPQRETLAPWRAREIRNPRGLLVGERVAAFRLTTKS
jgi:L-asparaginase II